MPKKADAATSILVMNAHLIDITIAGGRLVIVNLEHYMFTTAYRAILHLSTAESLDVETSKITFYW